MKIKAITCAGAALLGLALTPGLSQAQSAPENNTPGLSNQNTKDGPDPNKTSAQDTTQSQTTSPDQSNSKDAASPLDKNPSTAPTGSADKSATKDPNGENSEEGNKSASSEKLSDKSFLLKAAEGGMTEVELGKLAQEKGSSPDVKQFGSHMVMDHSKANDELKAVANEKGVTVPSSLDAKHQALVDKFSKLNGTAFDQAYVPAMVKDHEKDAALFNEESTSGEDPTVKAFASKTLKVVEAHLSDIKNIQSQMK
jgi:putative membrane protein